VGGLGGTVPVGTCLGALGFKNMGPPSVWNLPWDLSADAAIGDQSVQARI
jgi:hypothetical protein